MEVGTNLGGSAKAGVATHSLALYQISNAIIAAHSWSTDYPDTDASARAALADVVVSILSADGASLLQSAQFGGDVRLELKARSAAMPRSTQSLDRLRARRALGLSPDVDVRIKKCPL